MLQVSFIKENKEKVIKGLEKKFFPKASETVEEVLATDEERRSLQVQRDQVLAESNKISKQIGAMMKAGNKEEAEKAKAEAARMRNESKEISEKVTITEEKLTKLLYQIPNIPHESVPEGRTAEDNEIVLEGGEKVELDDMALPHWELISKYDIIDFDLGNKVTGAGFPFYKGKGARLQRALKNFFLDEAMDAGYTEVQPPIVVNEASALGTGQLPDKEGQMYKIENHDYYLIPTAEVPLTNIYRDEIVRKEDLPIKLAGFTPCFRREAGSWGADVRGLNRLHQFDKVEIIQVTTPEASYDTLIVMRNHIEGLLNKLELPYRILNLCGGDISFNAALCFDMEVYSAAQKRWLEVSSVSNFETFQANRLKLRYRDEDNKPRLAHTLNGSALALPRILAAILENNQTAEGIKIPKVLQPYCGFDVIS
ncbi:serine--tRNA ligase [Flammeovirgaceae bacterium SG7u.111]|nr:serine--tRNA ligase [Flammeovirgaceae bacterium SG7u.132]WPO35188.1 serine--tRNA ligase [Flammeovirgaceae bacterium SG7u.111]